MDYHLRRQPKGFRIAPPVEIVARVSVTQQGSYVLTCEDPDEPRRRFLVALSRPPLRAGTTCRLTVHPVWQRRKGGSQTWYVYVDQCE